MSTTNCVTTLYDLVRSGCEHSPAISAPGRKPLTFSNLCTLIEHTIADLHERGIGIGSRVAIVLPNGPEMATAFIAVACAATAAPLNPAYTENEFAFYLADLDIELLIVAEGESSPSIAVAAEQGIAIARLHAIPEAGAGSFALNFSGSRKSASPTSPVSPSDIALVLHTSGTTARPKIVPLSHANLCASARNIRLSLALTASDRGLNIMPLFHIHGLVAGILTPLSAGGEVSCPPGFNALKFFAWMEEVRPTWYTAVPSMHQAILERAPRHSAVIQSNPLRFLRSSSSSMPPQVMVALEKAFGAPLVEAYGMTEAAHQMASNPLPPKPRYPGSVGLSAGPEIAVVDADGEPLPAGARGEIVIRGDNVMSGYANNDEANAQAFTKHGWFRTGDEGILTPEGYLSLTGRLKEIINRGGAKISPREVDEIILDHPAVAQCVTFAIPHNELGEDVAAAVVLRDGVTIDAKGLRKFAALRLAPYKVPSHIAFVDQIPKGATGKPQRIGLAKVLGFERPAALHGSDSKVVAS